MKLDALLLPSIGLVLAWIGWNAFGPSTPAPTSHGGAASLSSPSLKAAVDSGQPVLVDFYADWCPPCRAMKPVVHELADDLHGKLQVVQVNVDQNPALSQQYHTSSIPCFVVLKGGKEVARQVGSMPKSQLRKLTGL